MIWPGVGDRAHDVRGHVHHALAIGALDRRQPALVHDPRRVGEGNGRARRRADAQLVEVSERASLIPRVAHHHPDLLGSALDALHLLAVEGLAHLPSEILEGQPERSRSGTQLELHLALRSGERVVQVHDAGVARQMRPDRGGGALEGVQIGAAELDVDRRSRGEQVGREGQALGLGERARALSPAIRDLVGADLALRRGCERHGDLADVRAQRGRRIEVDAEHERERLRAQRGEDPTHVARLRRRIGVELRAQLASRPAPAAPVPRASPRRACPEASRARR